MKTLLSPLVICAVLLVSCTITREERVLKKVTADWRKSPPVLDAYADSPFGSSFLTLRENNRFERTSSGMGIFRSFQAGSWTISNDTLQLFYLDSQQNTVSAERFFWDRETSTLIAEGTDIPVPMRLRVMRSKL